MKWLNAIRRFFATRGMAKYDVQELLQRVPRLQQPDVRIGWPDDPAQVAVADPEQFVALVDAALIAFDRVHTGALLVDAEVNDVRSETCVRFVKGESKSHGDGKLEPALATIFPQLKDLMQLAGGEMHYWGGNNYFGLSFPYGGSSRESFPEVDSLPWDERYQRWFEIATWESLRSRVFRYANFALDFGRTCRNLGKSEVLIPSVGVCVHPWQFADLGLRATATDVSPFALQTLSAPNLLPRVYSRAAHERWEISESSMYASQGSPESFSDLPDLANDQVVANLKKLLSLKVADWAHLPFENAAFDAIFATNALPRDSNAELESVIHEWHRVLRPGGVAFIAQHNFWGENIRELLSQKGWGEGPLLSGWHPADGAQKSFQLFNSSG